MLYIVCNVLYCMLYISCYIIYCLLCYILFVMFYIACYVIHFMLYYLLCYILHVMKAIKQGHGSCTKCAPISIFHVSWLYVVDDCHKFEVNRPPSVIVDIAGFSMLVSLCACWKSSKFIMLLMSDVLSVCIFLLLMSVPVLLWRKYMSCAVSTWNKPTTSVFMVLSEYDAVNVLSQHVICQHVFARSTGPCMAPPAASGWHSMRSCGIHLCGLFVSHGLYLRPFVNTRMLQGDWTVIWGMHFGWFVNTGIQQTSWPWSVGCILDGLLIQQTSWPWSVGCILDGLLIQEYNKQFDLGLWDVFWMVCSYRNTTNQLNCGLRFGNFINTGTQ